MLAALAVRRWGQIYSLRLEEREIGLIADRIGRIVDTEGFQP